MTQWMNAKISSLSTSQKQSFVMNSLPIFTSMLEEFVLIRPNQTQIILERIYSTAVRSLERYQTKIPCRFSSLINDLLSSVKLFRLCKINPKKYEINHLKIGNLGNFLGIEPNFCFKNKFYNLEYSILRGRSGYYYSKTEQRRLISNFGSGRMTYESWTSVFSDISNFGLDSDVLIFKRKENGLKKFLVLERSPDSSSWELYKICIKGTREAQNLDNFEELSSGNDEPPCPKLLEHLLNPEAPESPSRKELEITYNLSSN